MYSSASDTHKYTKIPRSPSRPLKNKSIKLIPRNIDIFKPKFDTHTPQTFCPAIGAVFVLIFAQQLHQDTDVFVMLFFVLFSLRSRRHFAVISSEKLLNFKRKWPNSGFFGVRSHTGSDDGEDNARHAGKFVEGDYKFKMAMYMLISIKNGIVFF